MSGMIKADAATGYADAWDGFHLADDAQDVKLFAQGDFIAPTVVAVNGLTPAVGQQPQDLTVTGVAAGPSIVLTFSEAVSAGGGGFPYIEISNRVTGDRVQIPITDASQVIFSGNTVTLKPAGGFLPGNTYVVQIVGGIRDVDMYTAFALINFTVAGGPQVGTAGADYLTGGLQNDQMSGLAGNDLFYGGPGNDVIDGGADVDTAVFGGVSVDYVITRSGTTTTVTGPDGADTLTNVENLKFMDRTIHIPAGTGEKVDFAASPATYAGGLRDYDGNNLGAAGSWQLIGQVDVNGDRTKEYILVNTTIGRWATIGVEYDGLTYFGDHGAGGNTRVVGTYIDPLVQSGQVVKGSPHDSQTRFANDLKNGNLGKILVGDDIDDDGYQELYIALKDGTAYLHAYMHMDGNIQYANYQVKSQVDDYLAANGWANGATMGWW